MPTGPPFPPDNWNNLNVDTLVDRLHRHHPDLTIVGQPALPLEGDTGADYGRLTISSPTSPCEYTLDLRADGISLRVAPVDM